MTVSRAVDALPTGPDGVPPPRGGGRAVQRNERNPAPC